MKKIITLTLALLLSMSFISCDEKEKSVVKENNNEAVSGIVEKEEENKAPTPDEEYVLYKDTYTKNGNYTVYDYNEKGHVVKRTTYYQNGETLETTYTNTYNDDGSYSVFIEGIGKKIEEYDAKCRRDVERGGAYPTYTYEYDEAGGMCKMTDSSTKTVYEYKPLSECIVK